jgi:excisionase family DNA binding protein
MKKKGSAQIVYTVPETAKLLGLGVNNCYDAINRGDIPSIRIGRRILVPCAALEGLLASAPRKPIHG